MEPEQSIIRTVAASLEVVTVVVVCVVVTVRLIR